MRKKSKAPTGQRPLRVAEHIRRMLSEILTHGDFFDPELTKPGLITVTAVEIGPDLKHATAYIMPLGGKDAEATVKVLNRISPQLRMELAPKLELRYTPKISFRLDVTFDEADKINRLLQKETVQKDLKRTDDDE